MPLFIEVHSTALILLLTLVSPLRNWLCSAKSSKRPGVFNFNLGYETFLSLCNLNFSKTLHVWNGSVVFFDFMRDKSLNTCEGLVSFEVVSLFTKIPVDLAVKDEEERLREDASLGQRTFCQGRILFICCLFASKPRNLHTTAPTINRFLVQLWVRPSLLSLPTW